MPTYDYACNECRIIFETRHGMNDLPLAVCPTCGKTTNDRLIGGPPTFYCKNTNTLGSLAEKNRLSMGGKIAEIQQRKARTYTGPIPEGAEVVQKPANLERPFWRKDLPVADTKLLKASPEAITKYVNTGERPFGTKL